MHFSTLTVISLVLSVASALPTTKRQAGPVLTPTTFNDISISGGVAGNAEAEALARFSALDLKNPGNIDPADLQFLNNVNQVANDAEKEAFNVAIDAASGADKDALQAGKMKNKVLKLEATIIKLQAQQAQGQDVAADLAAEQKKLDNNIAQDTNIAGQPSTALPFDATISAGK